MPNNNYEDILAKDEVLDFVKKKYQNIKSIKEILLSDPYYRFVRILTLLKKMKIPVSRDDTWLDLGCHHGQFLNLIGASYNCKLTGMDDWKLKDAMPFVKFDYHPVDLASADWPGLVAKGGIRYISALEVIEHMIDTDQFVEKCKNILADEGCIVISTPNINSLRNRIMVPFGTYPAYLEYRNVIHHVRLFNPKILVRFLDSHGFKTERCIGVSFLPEKLLRYGIFRIISEKLADWLPSLCGNIIVVAKKTV
jgi:2-polyprenyl-3-methyl-5-hydroxy-6-metoxy-1,4-benzoquinol methylase